MDEEIIQQYVQLGAPPEVIANLRQQMLHQDDIEIFEDCLPAIRVFQRMAHQWHRAGMEGVMVGMDYTALEIVMRRSGIAEADRDAVFEDIQTMEHETLKVYAEKRQ